MEESKKAIRGFISAIAIGFAVYIPLICAILLISGRFSVMQLLGAVYGSAVMILYYFIFAKATVRSADESDPEAAKKRIQASYSLRMLMLVILFGVGLFFSTDMAPIRIFGWLPMIISIIVPRITIAIWQLIFNKKSAGQKDGEQKDGN